MRRDRLHQHEKDEFLKLLRETGTELPPHGEEVLDAFLDLEGHISFSYLMEELKRRGVDVSPRELEELLDLFCRFGIAQKVLLNGRGLFYEHRHLGAEHDHLLCTACGRVMEFEDEALKARCLEIAERHSFRPVFHKMVILGICGDCKRGAERTGPSMPLTLAARGERLKVVGFRGGGRAVSRIQAMGISVGDTIQVINRAGPFIISAKGSRLALGQGLAEKVLVAPEPEGK